MGWKDSCSRGLKGRTNKSCSFYGGAAFRQVLIAACPG